MEVTFREGKAVFDYEERRPEQVRQKPSVENKVKKATPKPIKPSPQTLQMKPLSPSAQYALQCFMAPGESLRGLDERSATAFELGGASIVERNATGIPDSMKERFENLSGFSFDDVRVHYNSDKPAKLQALAYTQGNQVFVGPGQEKHLPHELGHVVQQKQGIVRPTTAMAGLPVNDDARLEQSADALAPHCGIAANTNVRVVQRLAMNATGVGVAEVRADLTTADVQAVAQGTNPQASILDLMRNQRNWIRLYRQTVAGYAAQPNAVAVPPAILDAARNALMSATNVAQDLYIIRKELDATAAADAAVPAAGAPLTTADEKLAKVNAVHGAVGLPGPLPVAVTDTTTYRATADNALPQTAGKRLIRMVKTQGQAFGTPAQGLSAYTVQLAHLYQDAGDVSNQSRILAGDAQIKIGAISRNAANAAHAPLPAHAADPGTTERMKSTIPIASRRENNHPCHGPALAEVDMFDNAGNLAGTVSAINDPLGRIPKKLHSLIAQDIRAMGAGGAHEGAYQDYLRMTKGAGSHAEVYAANKALVRREISTEAEAQDKLFGRIARTWHASMAPQIGDNQTLYNPSQREIPSFAQCPHCAAALATVTPAIYKNHRTYVEKCAYFLQQEIETYAPQSDENTWNCAHAMMDMPNWTTASLADYIYGLTHYGGTPEKDEKNWLAAEHLLANIELRKYHIAYHH